MNYVINLLQSSELEKLRKVLKTSQKLKKKLLEIVEKNELFHCTIKAYQILGCLEVSDIDGHVDVTKLVDLAVDQPDNLQSSIYKYLNANLKNCKDFDNLDFGFLYGAAILGSYIVKISISEILETIFSKFSSLKSLDTILNISRTLLLLLMDDEYEIREKNAKIVTHILNGKSDLQVLPIYAQEMYLKLLVEKLMDKFDLLEIVTLISAIFVDENDGELCQDSSIAEVIL